MPRAQRAWPLAWPSPSGPQGRQRLRRSRAGPEDPFCEAVRKDLRVPLTTEGPPRTMRGVPVLLPCDRFTVSAHLARRTGQARDACRHGAQRGVTAGTADLRERASRPGGGGAPVRAFAREGATWPPPRTRTVGLPFPALGPGGGARFSHALSL